MWNQAGIYGEFLARRGRIEILIQPKPNRTPCQLGHVSMGRVLSLKQEEKILHTYLHDQNYLRDAFQFCPTSVLQL